MPPLYVDSMKQEVNSLIVKLLVKALLPGKQKLFMAFKIKMYLK